MAGKSVADGSKMERCKAGLMGLGYSGDIEAGETDPK
jgi:hypothetical protein